MHALAGILIGWNEQEAAQRCARCDAGVIHHWYAMMVVCPWMRFRRKLLSPVEVCIACCSFNAHCTGYHAGSGLLQQHHIYSHDLDTQ
jgi:hypothetical protein